MVATKIDGLYFETSDMSHWYGSSSKFIGNKEGIAFSEYCFVNIVMFHFWFRFMVNLSSFGSLSSIVLGKLLPL